MNAKQIFYDVKKRLWKFQLQLMVGFLQSFWIKQLNLIEMVDHIKKAIRETTPEIDQHKCSFVSRVYYKMNINEHLQTIGVTQNSRCSCGLENEARVHIICGRSRFSSLKMETNYPIDTSFISRLYPLICFKWFLDRTKRFVFRLSDPCLVWSVRHKCKDQ